MGMLISLILAAAIIGILAVSVLPKQLGLLKEKPSQSDSISQVSPLGFAQSQTQAQLRMLQFTRYLQEAVPPIDNIESAQRARFMLSSSAISEVSDDPRRITRDFARLMAVPDLPDQGIRIEGLATTGEDHMTVALGLYYSGSGVLYRNANLLFEDGSWKIDSFSKSPDSN